MRTVAHALASLLHVHCPVACFLLTWVNVMTCLPKAGLLSGSGLHSQGGVCVTSRLAVKGPCAVQPVRYTSHASYSQGKSLQAVHSATKSVVARKLQVRALEGLEPKILYAMSRRM